MFLPVAHVSISKKKNEIRTHKHILICHKFLPVRSSCFFSQGIIFHVVPICHSHWWPHLLSMKCGRRKKPHERNSNQKRTSVSVRPYVITEALLSVSYLPWGKPAGASLVPRFNGKTENKPGSVAVGVHKAESTGNKRKQTAKNCMLWTMTTASVKLMFEVMID